MAAEQKQKLEQQLWNIANTLRGKMDADDFRDYILGFIFYKYLSTKMDLYANTILKPDGLTFQEVEGHADEAALLEEIKQLALDKLGYFLLPSELFSELARRGNAGGKNNFILGDLAKVLTHIEQSTMGSESEEDFGNLFSDLDLTSHKLGKSEADKNELIVKVLVHLDEIDFDLENTDSDVLGDAYEYLIGQFASGAGKKAGEFYTPQQVSSILAQLVTVGKDKLKSVYDPTCGSGSLLLRVAKEVKDVSAFYGQEMNPTTYNLCRMNMIMHDVHYKRFDIKNEDTLERPQHYDMRFEAIVANPPFSANWSASPLHMNDERFSAYGKLAPSSKADFAFVQHMVHQLADNGTMAIVLPHGVLFRGGAEGHIREYLIKEKNYLDAVIGLPANIFYGTSIPTCILVLKKKRADAENILFIDASQHFEKVKTQNVLRTEDIDKIISTYENRTEEDKYSHIAPIIRTDAINRVSTSSSSLLDAINRVSTSIAENDYNLNIPRYVDTFEEEEEIIVNDICISLEKLSDLSNKNDDILKKQCDILKIPFPNGHNISLLEQYKKGVMQQLFSGKLRFKDENGEDYPDWEEKRLGDFCTFFSGGTPTSTIQKFYSGTIPFIGSGNIYDSEVFSFISEEALNSSSAKIVEKGDLLYALYGANSGELAISKMNGAINQAILCIRNQESIEYLYYVLLLNKDNIVAKFLQGGQGNLSAQIIKRLKYKFPSIPEQQKIANFLSSIDTKIETVNGEIGKTQLFKKGLLQQMFV